MYTPLLQNQGQGKPSSGGSTGTSGKSGTPAILKEVKKLIQERDIEGAKSVLLKAVEDEPENGAFLLVISKLLTLTKDYDNAFVFAQRASKADPLNAKALIQQASIKLKQEQYTDALEIIKASLALDPSSLKSFHIQQRLYGKINDYANLVSSCDACLNLYPFDSRSYINKSSAFTKQGQDQEAVILLNTAVQMVPKSSPLYAQLGDIYFSQGQFSKAIASLQESLIDQKSSRPTIYIKLAKCYLELADYSQCRDTLKGFDSALKTVKRKSLAKKIESKYQFTKDFIYACSLKENPSPDPYNVAILAILRRMLIDEKTLHGVLTQELTSAAVNDLAPERAEELVKAAIPLFESKSGSDDDTSSSGVNDDDFEML